MDIIYIHIRRNTQSSGNSYHHLAPSVSHTYTKHNRDKQFQWIQYNYFIRICRNTQTQKERLPPPHARSWVSPILHWTSAVLLLSVGALFMLTTNCLCRQSSSRLRKAIHSKWLSATGSKKRERGSYYRF